MRKDTLTVTKLRRAIDHLKKNNIPSDNGYYTMRANYSVLLDLLFTYKRPRSTILYKKLKEALNNI